MFNIDKTVVDNLKKIYLPEKRVRLEKMMDPYRNIPKGTMGTVIGVDDIGTIHVKWDNGYKLGVVYGEDSCTLVEE